MKIELTVSAVSGLLLEYRIRDFSAEPGEEGPLAVRGFWERRLEAASAVARKAYAAKVTEEDAAKGEE